MDEVKITKLINGPEAFTPDNEFCLGESEVRGFFVAAGFCAHGLAGAGGIGRVIAEWIAEGEPSLDLWEMDVRRFGSQYRSPSYTHARIRETYETYYDIRYPNHERSAGRPLRIAAGERLARRARRRVRREVGLGAGQLVRVERRRGRRVAAPARLGRPALVAGDRRRASGDARGGGDLRRELVREARDRGPGAAELLERLCDNRVAREVGKITYTQMLNRRGGIECDFTVARLAEELFSIVTGTAFGNHDREWIRKHLPEDGAVQVRDVTSAWSCFGIWGPRARDVLAPLTPQDLSNEAFPYMSVREITIGNVPVRALRVTYVGELGWELYCPTEYGLGLWRTLWEAGRAARPRRRRLPGDRLAAAREGLPGLGRRHHPRRDALRGRASASASSSTRTGGFIGREALVEAERARVRARGSAAWCSPTRARSRSATSRSGSTGEIVGRVTTGGYGYTVERSIAYAYLPPEHAEPGTAVEVEIFGEWVSGEVAARAALRSRGRADPGRRVAA